MRYMMTLFLLLSSVGWAQTKASVASKPKVEDFTKSQPQPVSAPGRYQIFFSPHGRADTFLVDTSTGRIWVKTAFSHADNAPSAWMIEDRLDTPDEVAAWIDLQQRKAAFVKALETPPVAITPDTPVH